MFRGLILIIDRYVTMNELISDYLTASGYQTECLCSMEQVTDRHFLSVNFVLLDINTAGEQLREVIEKFRAAGIPVIVLTPQEDASGRLSALEMGAADVMSRPVDIAELAARIRSAQSRSQIGIPSSTRPEIKFGGLTVNISTYTAFLDGQPLDLSPKQISLLYLLLCSPGRVFTRAEMARQIVSGSSGRTISLHISRIKKQIGRYSENITAVRSVGYKFSGENI